MTEREAVKKGYSFTGAYSHDKEEMKLRAAEERAKGNKAIVVDTPPSKYSRGYSGMGYSVYYIQSEANRTEEIKQINLNCLNNLEYEKNILLEKLQKINEEIEERRLR